MYTNRQIFRHSLTTTRTYLASSIRSYFNYFSTSVFSFVGKKIKEYTPTAIANGFAQMSVSYHVFNLQVFNIDHLKFYDILISNFVQKIFSLIGYLFMRFSNQDSCFVPAARTFLSSRKFSISAPKLFFRIDQVFRISYLAPFTIDTKRLYANIDTHSPAGLRKLFNRNIITGKGDKPFASRHTPNSDSFDIAFNRPGKEKFEPAHIPDIQIPTLKFISRLREGEGVVTVAVLKAWESCFFSRLYSAEKSFIGLIKTAKHIAQGLGIYYFDFRKVFLDRRQLVYLIIARKRFSSFFKSVNSLIKRGIVNITAYIKPAIAIGLGLLVYLCPIKKCFSHFCFFTYSSIARRMSSATDNPVCSDSSFSRLICASVK